MARKTNNVFILKTKLQIVQNKKNGIIVSSSFLLTGKSFLDQTLYRSNILLVVLSATSIILSKTSPTLSFFTPSSHLCQTLTRKSYAVYTREFSQIHDLIPLTDHITKITFFTFATIFLFNFLIEQFQNIFFSINSWKLNCDCVSLLLTVLFWRNSFNNPNNPPEKLMVLWFDGIFFKSKLQIHSNTKCFLGTRPHKNEGCFFFYFWLHSTIDYNHLLEIRGQIIF